MASGRLTRKWANFEKKETPLNKVFLSDVMSAIEKVDNMDKRTPSEWYKPSSFTCMRQMYFMRTKQETDGKKSEYNNIGAAKSGSARHETIQDVLLKMKDLGYDWEYMDIVEYLKMMWAKGKCLDIEIRGKVGAETKLFHKKLLISFMCDGVMKRISSGQFYLFELKTQISFKYNSDAVNGRCGNKTHVDLEHHAQVATYCLCLELDSAFVLYENRDTCELECPELYEVTEQMKQEQLEKVLKCEKHVKESIVPPANPNQKKCRYCDYESSCKKVGFN